MLNVFRESSHVATANAVTRLSVEILNNLAIQQAA
jgi:hypothetical protein